MFEAQILNRGATIYSPWFPRQSDSARFTLEVVAVSGATMGVEVFTKRSDDGGDGVNADSAGSPTKISASVVGRTTTEWLSRGTVSLLELVRYKFTVTGTNAYDWVLFRMLPPVWFDSVQAS
jgi:hypothetical protein